MIRLILLPAFFMLIGAACDGNGSDAARTEDAAERTGTSGAGSGAASSFAWLNDPCSLIGDQEMTDLLPNPVAGSVITRGVCEYGPVDLSLGRVDVEIFIQDVSATGCELFFSVGAFNSGEPVDAIGSAARWNGESGIKQLGVCTDDLKAFAVSIYDPDKTTDALTIARAVAELVIARLAER
jgi:hypothetical protein